MKKVGAFIRECVEMYIPMIAFVVLFVIFVFQVFMRYVMKNPQAWTAEVEQSCFLWLVLLGACYAQRVKGHVTFTLVYDSLKVKGKAITAMLGNILITFACLITLMPSAKYIIGQLERAQLTSVLKWQKAYVFAPYVLFLAIIAVYAIMDIYEEIMVLKGDQKYIDKMLAESKSEAEIAIEESLAQEQLDLNHIDYGGKGDK
ncbi:MAG: TRAP transporter small permease [Lawsonibacter sp.]|nr:TRAP transporter small permease [Lawsonibacter sp.]